MFTDLPAVRECERLMTCDGGEQCIGHEVEVILISQHVPRKVAALRERLHRVHIRDLQYLRLCFTRRKKLISISLHAFLTLRKGNSGNAENMVKVVYKSHY